MVQSGGIIGGLFFAAISARQDAKARRLNAALSLAQQHREIWSELHRRPELGRILQGDVDLVSQPTTVQEEEFLNVAFVHVQVGWEIAQSGSIVEEDTLRSDMRHFLSYPLPRSVWNRTKGHREPGFVTFMESCVA